MNLVKDSLTEQIYGLIKERIITQEYELGQKIDTNEIAENNNISVMPVRDALNSLEDDGLVTKKSRVGYFVRVFSKKEAEDIMEARKMYEIYSVESYFSEFNLDFLQDLHGKMLELQNNMSRDEFDELDYEFHQHIINISGNDYIIKNYNQINEMIQLFRRLDKDRMEEANCEHMEIIDFIVRQKLEKSKKSLNNHIEKVKRSLLQNLK